jgi:putative 4-mercaptohistidine N1-methyltranferase
VGTVVYPKEMAGATLGTSNTPISPDLRGNPYETDKLLNEYLLFHYGSAAEVLPYPWGPADALNYPVRCVEECVRGAGPLAAGARALDLGCAVGRSSFELARLCSEVVGIDFSHRFIQAAEQIRASGGMDYFRLDEGECGTVLRANRPAGIDPETVRFEQGDAMALREDLGRFEVVLLANLIDRLNKPVECLARLPELVSPGGLLVVTSPYTWMPEYTAKEDWLGGVAKEGTGRSTLEGLRTHLQPAFRLESTRELPFLIREHARKYQWSVAQASMWRRTA